MLDHGQLNTPIDSRGGLFGETRTQHDARVKREAAAKKAATKAATTEALELVASVSESRMAELGAPYGMNAAKTRQVWRDMARQNPAAVIKTLTKELKQA